MWREIRQLAAKKPVIASMGDVAASGGYYLAMAATKIVAEPLTITGSIGVVTGAPGGVLGRGFSSGAFWDEGLGRRGAGGGRGGGGGARGGQSEARLARRFLLSSQLASHIRPPPLPVHTYIRTFVHT